MESVLHTKHSILVCLKAFVVPFSINGLCVEVLTDTSAMSC